MGRLAGLHHMKMRKGEYAGSIAPPLLGHNGIVGDWMVVLVDENSTPVRSFRQAPPVTSEIGHSRHSGAALETETSGFVNGQLRE